MLLLVDSKYYNNESMSVSPKTRLIDNRDKVRKQDTRYYKKKLFYISLLN